MSETMNSRRPAQKMVNGRILRGEALREWAERHGRCNICFETKTHRLSINILSRKQEPLTLKDDEGNFTVYKGCCLHPTCWGSIDKARMRLGEITQYQDDSSSHSSISSITTPPHRSSDGSSTNYNTARYSTKSSKLQLLTNDQKPLEEDLVLTELESMAKDKDYIQFFNKLETHGKSAFLVIEGFRLLRESVTKAKEERPASIILSGEAWVKIVKDKMQKFKDTKRVVLEGLSTISTLCTLPGNCKRAMVRKGIVDTIISAIDASNGDEEIEKLCCEVLELFSQNPKDKLDANFKSIHALIRNLSAIVAIPNHSGTGLALCTFYNLGTRRKISDTTGKKLIYDIQRSLEGETLVRAITEITQKNNLSEKVALASLSLLWRLSAISSVGGENESSYTIPVTDQLIDALSLVMQKFDSADLVEASCGTLANLALNPDFPATRAEQANVDICLVLSAKANIINENLATSALQAIYNLLTVSVNTSRQNNDSLDYKIMQTVMNLMLRFPESEDVLDLACYTISHAGRHNATIAELAVTNGGFELIHKALRNHIACQENASSDHRKDVVLGTIEILSCCQVGACQITKSGMAQELEKMLDFEHSKDFKSTIQKILQNCIGPHISIATINSEQESHLFSRSLHGAKSEGDVLSLLKNLKEFGESRVLFLGAEGIEALLSIMTRFRSSLAIQRHCCEIVSEALLKSDHDACAIIYEKAINGVVEGLALHVSDAPIAKHACHALTCIIPSTNRQRFDTVKSILGTSLLDVLKRHKENEKISTVALDSLKEYASRIQYSEVTAINEDMIQAVVSSMNRHLQSVELQCNGCNFLKVLCSGSCSNPAACNTRQMVVEEEGIQAVVNALFTHNTSPAIALAGINTVKTLAMCSSNKPRLSSAGAEDAVMFSIYTHESNAQILSSAFAALNNIAVDSRTRTVTQMRQDLIFAVVCAMERFQDDQELQRNACVLLKSYSYLVSNLALISRYEMEHEKLAPVLQLAAIRFPQKCGEVAVGFMKRLEQYSVQ